MNRASAQWEPRLLANLYASAALEADDAHGEEHELIIQHDGIKRLDLAAVIELAATAVDGPARRPRRVAPELPAL